MVESGVRGEKILCFFGADAGSDQRAIEFFFPGFGEGFVHVGADGERVGGLPGLRPVLEKFELNGEIVLVLVNEAVDAAGVGVHDGARFVVEESGVAFGRWAEAEQTEMLVDADGRGAEDFRELATGYAAEEIHLPEAVLSHDVALGLRHIGEGSGADVGDAPGVTLDDDLSLQTRKRSGAIQPGERTEEEPPGEAAGYENKQSQNPTDDTQEQSQKVASKKE